MKLDNLTTVKLLVDSRSRLEAIIAALDENAPEQIAVNYKNKSFHTLLNDGLDVIDWINVSVTISEAIRNEMHDCIGLYNEKLAELGVEL